MQSLQRQIKRGHVRVKMSEFVKNEDGTQKVIIEKIERENLIKKDKRKKATLADLMNSFNNFESQLNNKL